jgi:hypothetical protein
MVLVTVKLNNGHFVLGRLIEGKAEAFQYANRTQANQRAEEVGGVASQFRSPSFYVLMDAVDEDVGAQANSRRAGVLGVCAFAMGVSCVPALDPVLMATLSGRRLADPRSIAEMKAWTEAWTQANLAAEVPDRVCPPQKRS